MLLYTKLLSCVCKAPWITFLNLFHINDISSPYQFKYIILLYILYSSYKYNWFDFITSLLKLLAENRKTCLYHKYLLYALLHPVDPTINTIRNMSSSFSTLNSSIFAGMDDKLVLILGYSQSWKWWTTEGRGRKKGTMFSYRQRLVQTETEGQTLAWPPPV